MAVSANTLFHFTNCLDNLVSILASGGFWPRYCMEYGWKRKLAVCQCCFCDIPLSNIQNHVKNYGYYGLGMSKDWGISNGLSPVMYFIKDSFMGGTILAMSKSAENTEKKKLISMLKVYKGVNYIKDEEGKRKRQNSYPYYDEREWRYIPSSIAPENVCVFVENDADENVSKLNDTTKDKLLKFTVDDIKYVVVENSQRDKLLEEIKKMQIYSDKDKEVLMSKILTSELILTDI